MGSLTDFDLESGPNFWVEAWISVRLKRENWRIWSYLTAIRLKTFAMHEKFAL
jgi:hypothetical protein